MRRRSESSPAKDFDHDDDSDRSSDASNSIYNTDALSRPVATAAASGEHGARGRNNNSKHKITSTVAAASITSNIPTSSRAAAAAKTSLDRRKQDRSSANIAPAPAPWKSPFTLSTTNSSRPANGAVSSSTSSSSLSTTSTSTASFSAAEKHAQTVIAVPSSSQSSPSSGVLVEDKMAEPRAYRRARMRSPWSCSLLALATTAAAAFLLYITLQSLTTRQLDVKGCRMPYMRPAYAKFDDFDTEHTRFASKYSLYLYREGGIDEDTKVKGVPVLFIPGNAGSYKQVRPIAAEAAEYFHNPIQHDEARLKAGTRSLDFFTVDFNEDITAFHGQTLLDQAEYLNEAVAFILSLYHDPRRSRRDPNLPDPSAVILVGHSMGGIVARTMLTMHNYQSNSINTIITMSAPHARPPVSFDSDIVRTYKQINDYWRQAYSQQWANNNPLWHVTLISIAGGGLDTVVPSDYASLASLVPDTHGFTVFTSSIANVWTGMDHQSILWCDQFRKVIVRALIDIVDVRRPVQTKSRADRMRIFKKWFLTGMESKAEKALPQQEPTTLLTLEDNSNSIIQQGKRLTLRNLGGQVHRPQAYLLPVPPPQGTSNRIKFTLLSDQHLDAAGESGTLEVLFCSVFPLELGQSASIFSMNMDLSGNSSGSTRLACKNAAADSIPLPSSSRSSKYPFEESAPYSYLEYDLEDIAKHQFVAVVDKASESTLGWAIAEFSDLAESTIQTDVGLRGLLTSGLHLRLDAQRPMVSDIKIPALHSSLLAYNLKLGSQACGDEAELFTPLLRQYVTEPYESKYFVNVREANINLHGIAPYMPPALQSHAANEGLSLQLWTDPTCNTSVDVSLTVDIMGSMGKLYMRYRTVFAAFPLLVVALVIRKQFKVYDESGIFMSFSESIDLCLRKSLPILFIALSFLAISLARANVSSTTPTTSGFLFWRRNATEAVVDYARNDLLLGSQDPFFWFLVPMLGLVSVGICVIINYVTLAITHILSVMLGFFMARPVWLREDDRRRSSSPPFTSSTPRRRFITTVILLFLVSTLIPYQFAYLVACLAQLFSCIRALRIARETRSGSHYNFYNYAHSLLILMLWILPINLPVLVVWIHNLAVHWLTPFSSHHNVLSITPFILLVETLSAGTMIPRLFPSRLRYVTNTLLFGLAIYAAVYGVTHAYLLHHLGNLFAAWLTAVHFSNTSFASLKSFSQFVDAIDLSGGGGSASGSHGASGVDDDAVKKRP